MGDFIINNSSISCIDLKINNQIWPNDYTNATNNYLKYTADGISWQPSTTIVNNDLVNNNYLIMNNSLGSDTTELKPITIPYLRCGLGSQTGGADNKGTGLTYTPRGQITIGLMEEDTLITSNVFGSTMTQHLSLTDKEVSVINTKESTQLPLIGGLDYNKSLFTSTKLDTDGLKQRENSFWTETNYLNEELNNKYLNAPSFDGKLVFPSNYTNTSFGSNSGSDVCHKDYKLISETFRSHKNLGIYFEIKDNTYNTWEIETTTNNIKSNNIIEEYTNGYSKLYGVFGSNNTLVNNTENTFNTTNNYYLGWTLSVLYYTSFTISNSTTAIIPCGSILTMTPSSGASVDIVLNDTLDTSSNSLKLPYIKDNISGFTVTIKGIPDSTFVLSGGGTTTITLSTSVNSLIAAGTTLEFGNGSTGTILSDVISGNQITLTNNTSSDIDNESVIIKGIANNTTLTGIFSSQKYSHYTVVHSGIQSDTIVSSHTADSTIVTLSIETQNTVIKSGTIITFTNSSTQINGTVNGDVSIGSTSITLLSAPSNSIDLTNYTVSIQSLTARYIDRKNADLENTITNENNIYEYLTTQVPGTNFYLSTQNQEHFEGIFYGEKRGKMTSSLTLSMYDAKPTGFYIGWKIYAWNNELFLSKNLVSDIPNGTAITATSYDGTNTVNLTTSGISTTTSPNIITLTSVPNENLNNYIITINSGGTAIPSQTQIITPQGIIQGYNAVNRTIQVLFNVASFISSNTTEYLLKPENALSDNLNTYNDYYKGWSIYIEEDKYYNNYSEPNKYIINNHYSQNRFITNPWEGKSGLMVDSTTIKSIGKKVNANYFKDWIIGVYTPTDDSDTISPQNIADITSNTALYRGVIISHDSSLPTAIDSNTTVSVHETISGIESEVITLSAATTADIPSGSTIFFTKTDGSIKHFITDGTTSSGSTTITLSENPGENLLNYVILHYSNITNVNINWETPNGTPNNISSTTKYYLTYNNTVTGWGDTNYKEVNYNTIVASFHSRSNNDSNPDKHKGLLKTVEHSSGSGYTDRTNRVQFFTDSDDAGITSTVDVEGQPPAPKVTDFSPPSSIDNYYKGWSLTTRFTNTTDQLTSNITKTIIHYDGTNKIATLDGDIFQQIDNSDPPEEGQIRIRGPYILTKNLVCSEVSTIQDSIIAGSYVLSGGNTNTVTLNSSLNSSISANTLIRFTPPYAFQPNTVITNVNPGNSPSQHTHITLNKPIMCDLKTGTLISYTSETGSSGTYVISSVSSSTAGGTSIYIDAGLMGGSSIYIGWRIDNYGSEIDISTSLISTGGNPQTIALTMTPPENVTGWFVSINNDRKYKLKYENYNGIMNGEHTLSSNSSNINDFYKDWSIISTDSSDIRKITTITSYINNTTSSGLLMGFPTGDTTGDSENTKYILIPSKNIKYGINGLLLTDNTTMFKLISPYNEVKNIDTLIENGVLASINQLSAQSSTTDNYYNGWKILTQPTITKENNKIIFTHGSNENDTVTTLTPGYYDASSLKTELETQLNSAAGVSGVYTVSYDSTTEKLTINSTSGDFCFKWSESQIRYKSVAYELLGFNNVDGGTNVTSITSDNKISLYSTKPESSIIDKYYGSSKTFTTNIFRADENTRPLITPTNDKTIYQLVPPDHTKGTLEIDGATIKLEENNCILEEGYYKGWIILTFCNGNKQFSYINNYNHLTREVTCPSLDTNTLISNNTKYHLSKISHYNGMLRSEKIINIPEEGRNTITVEGFSNYVFGDIDDDMDPVGVFNDPSVSSSDIPPTEIVLKLNGNNLSIINDYYKGWTISIFVKGVMYITKVLRYYGASGTNQYKIEIEDFDYKLALDNSNSIEYILYEPQIIKLSYNAIPIDDFYRGWTISVKTNGIIQTSLITKYYGDTRQIIANNLTDIYNNKSFYELIEHREGLMKGVKKLSDMASYINNYYVGWYISLLEDDGSIYKTEEITGYNLIDKEITSNLSSTASGTRYKLYNNSHNTSIGNYSGKKNKVGFRNISLGNNSGPTNNSDSDKLFISSNNIARGDKSFIYGNMSQDSEQLLINGSLKINGPGGLSQGGTDTKSLTFPSTRGSTGETLVLGSNGILTWGSSGSDLTIQDEGTPLSTAATTLDFKGSGVKVTGDSSTKTIEINNNIANGPHVAPANQNFSAVNEITWSSNVSSTIPGCGSPTTWASLPIWTSFQCPTEGLYEVRVSGGTCRTYRDMAECWVRLTDSTASTSDSHDWSTNTSNGGGGSAAIAGSNTHLCFHTLDHRSGNMARMFFDVAWAVYLESGVNYYIRPQISQGMACPGGAPYWIIYWGGTWGQLYMTVRPI